MLVKLLTNLGSHDYPDSPYLEGEEREVSGALAEKLLRNKHAIDVTPTPKPVQSFAPQDKTVSQEQPVESVQPPAVPAKKSKEK